MMKYPLGTKILIRSDLNTDTNYSGIGVVPSMLRFAGRIVTITSYGPRNHNYHIEEDHGSFIWSGPMFVPIGNDTDYVNANLGLLCGVSYGNVDRNTEKVIDFIPDPRLRSRIRHDISEIRRRQSASFTLGYDDFLRSFDRAFGNITISW